MVKIVPIELTCSAAGCVRGASVIVHAGDRLAGQFCRHHGENAAAIMERVESLQFPAPEPATAGWSAGASRRLRAGEDRPRG